MGDTLLRFRGSKMNQRIESLLKFILNKEHHCFRSSVKLDTAEEFSSKLLSPTKRMSERLVKVLETEKPVILEWERIVGLRTVTSIPDIFTPSEWNEVKKDHFLHEKGYVCNICPDYASTIGCGLEAKRREASKRLERCYAEKDPEGIEFLESVISAIDAVEAFADKYLAEARRLGRTELVGILEHIPRYGARTFHEALQFFRLLHFVLWCEGEYHNTIGRFDQYAF